MHGGRRRTTRRGLNAVLLAVLATLAMAVPVPLVGPAAAATAAGVLTVTPSSGLLDGDRVTVSTVGAQPDSDFTAYLCDAAQPEPGGCSDQLGWDIVDADGTASTEVTVRAVVRTHEGDLLDCRIDACNVIGVVFAADGVHISRFPVAFDPDGPLLPPPALHLDPTSGLVDGQVVTLTGSGFYAGSEVSISICHPDGDCRSLAGATAGPDGTLSAAFQLRAVIPAPPWGGDAVDCRTAATPCVVGVYTPDGEIEVELSFDPTAPLLPPPTLTLEPAGTLDDGATVTISGAGHPPDGWVDLSYCKVGTDDCDRVWWESPDVEADGTFTVVTQLHADLILPSGFFDCREAPGCEIRAWSPTDGTVSVPVAFAPAGPQRRYLDPVFDEVEVTRDLLYRSTTDADGDPVDLHLDVYRPAGDTAGKRPAIVWMFGGWFRFGDKDQLADYARDAARRGYVGITIDYRIRPSMPAAELEAAAGDAYDDALAAVDWLKANAATYGIDPDAIVTAGYSAGGVLAWNLAYLPPDRGPATSPVAASVAIAGLPFAGPQAGDPPVLGIHAADDAVVPMGPARDRCLGAAAVGAVCEWVEYPSGGHLVVLDQARDIVRRLYDFLARNVLAPRGYLDPAGPPGPRPRPAPVLPAPAPPAVPTTSTPATAPPSTSAPPTTVPGGSPTAPPPPPTTVATRPPITVAGEARGPSTGGAADQGVRAPGAPAAEPREARPRYTG